MEYSIKDITTILNSNEVPFEDLNISLLLTDSRSLKSPAETLFFAIKSKRADVSALDKLAISIEAASDESGVHTVGAVGLKGGQGIKLSNIVFEVSGDVEIELGK